LPLGEPSDQPSDFKLTTSQKNQLRTIEVGCENQIAMAYLTSEQVGRIVEQKCEEHYQNFLNSFKNTDIINQAIANHDPSLCEKTQSQSKCILKYVDENNEPDACKLLEENTECFRTYALKVKEPTICLQAKNSEECVNGLFVPLGSSVCQIWDGEKKSECHYSYIIQKKMPTFPTYTTLNSPTSFETSNPSLYECAPIANNSFYYYSIASACYHEILNDGLISAQELISLEDEN